MLARIFPFLDWFKGYGPAALKADFTAGLTVALVLIPQSMAYAQLAGLPAYYGLYAAFLPPLAAALFGSSRQLATGPVAVVSLMTAAALEPLATAGSASFVAYAVSLSLMAGLIQFFLGFLRLGLVVNFISHPVINGFSNAAALIIASSQLAKFFGVSVDKAELHLMTVVRVFQAAAHHLHLPSLLLGLLAFGIMLVMKRINPRSPYVLTAVLVTTLISWLTDFETNRIVSVKDFNSPALESTLKEFNHEVQEISNLAAARARANAEADTIRDHLGAGSHHYFRLRAKAATLTVEMDEAKALAVSPGLI